jgi:hypothetical protein
MWTFTSLIDLSQAALFIDLFPVFNFHLLTCVCAQIHYLFFGRPLPLTQYNIYGTRVAEVLYLTKQ